MLHNVDLVEEDKRVENGEGRVVEDACEDDVFNILEAVGVVDLFADVRFFDVDHFFETRGVREVLPVVCFVGGEIGII